MPDHDRPRPEQDPGEPLIGHITARTQPDRVCQSCDQATVQVVAVTALVGAEERPIGGWAVCLACGTSPHPLLEGPDA
ncbi:hypothetical protein ACFWH1_18425 [Streptomyces sp. NPDC127037]|uniref:hypothetical protein n=1 Tax=Streptomyces sp. NPDC127037 TaxID=3347113 RepID=UPI0036607F27